MKIKKIYKYPTGATIPEGAIYLNTVTQTDIDFGSTGGASGVGGIGGWCKCWLVWHYFLVEVEEE